MTITLSINEIRALVCRTYALPSDTLVNVADVEEKNPSADVVAFFEAMSKYLLADGRIDPLNKIAAIKRLREIIPGDYTLSLASAKNAIDCWPNLGDSIRFQNRLPRVENGSNGELVW